MNSVRELSRRKNFDRPTQEASRNMHISQRNVRGSEAEGDSVLPTLFALMLWYGCSSLFFALSPHDTRSPITMSLLQCGLRLEKQFSLGLPAAYTEACIA